MIAKTFRELEDVLADELIGLGAENVEIGNRMVSFEGDLEMLYKANMGCRTALRILKPIYTFVAASTDEVYEKIKEIEWEEYLTPDRTFSVDSTVNSDDFRHSKFLTYRVKDAIADYFNEKYEKRPSVRMNKADLMLNLHISDRNCTLSIDSSGEPLYKRGYRVGQTEAPLNEVLAAGMILKSGWKGDSNFIDPMCGSGTLLIEAALIACNIAPGVYRHDYAFERWYDFDEELFDRLYNDDSNEREFLYKIYGSDISPQAIRIAEENVKSAGLAKYIDLQVMPFQKYEVAPENGILITNPPYGERISSDDLLGLYQMLGERLKHVFRGYDAWIISYRDECFDKIGLKPAVKIGLMNGALECQYRKYEIFDGKYKDFKTEGNDFRERKRERTAHRRLSRDSRFDNGFRRNGHSERPSSRFDRRENRDTRFEKPVPSSNRFRDRNERNVSFKKHRSEKDSERPSFKRQDSINRTSSRSMTEEEWRSLTSEERMSRARFTISDGTEKFISFKRPSIPDPDKKISKRERFIKPKNNSEETKNE